MTEGPVDQERRVFRLTLEDLQDDAFRKKGPLDRTAVDALYLKRGITPEEAIAIEKALVSSGVAIQDETGGVDLGNQEALGEVAATALDHLLRLARKQPLLTREDEIRLGKAIQRGLSLDTEAKGELPTRIRETAERARAKLVTRNVRLVAKVAFDRRYRGRLEADDLVQIGLIGLMRAAEKFDPTWETRFSTYAMWWIRQALGRGIADQGTTIRIPVHMRQAISLYRRTARGVDQASGNQVAIIAENLGWTVEYTAKIATFAEQRTISIDEPIGREDDLTLKDVLADDGEGPEGSLIQKDIAQQIQTLVKALEDRRLADILYRRFGFFGHEQTLQEIGDDYGVTRERIRQLEARALRILKKRSEAKRLAKDQLNWNAQ